MEASDLTVLRASSLGIDCYRITSFHQRLQFRQQFLNAFANGIVLRISNQQTIGGIVPYPVVGQKHDVWRKDQLTEEIQVRLMVTDDHPGTVELHAVFHTIRELHAWDAMRQHHEP